MTYWNYDSATTYLLAMAAVVFAHASFQLGVSVLTLLSSHTIGAAKSHRTLLRLTSSYVLGIVAALIATLAAVSSLVESAPLADQKTTWLLLAGLSAAVGLLVIAFYYRRSQKGTTLWVPRAFAEYLSSRTKKTRSSVEAFALGIVTVIAELPFSLTALVIFAFLIHGMEPASQLNYMAGYAVAVSLPLVFVAGMITSGHKISTIQRWRENNKAFLQWSSGVTFLLLAAYLAVLYLDIGVTG